MVENVRDILIAQCIVQRNRGYSEQKAGVVGQTPLYSVLREDTK